MKLYLTNSLNSDGAQFNELSSSNDGASKIRTRLKKLEHEKIKTAEVEIEPTRSGIIAFFNEHCASLEEVSA